MSSPEGGDTTVAEPVDDEATRAFGIVVDGVVGAASGFVGMALMTGVLLVTESLGGFSREAFAALTALLGIEESVPPILFGYLVFMGHGMVTWPLLFAAVREYLPGEREAVRGAVFGTALWFGFLPAFYTGYGGTTLALYLAGTLVAHWAYGTGLGVVFNYLTTRPGSVLTSPSA